MSEHVKSWLQNMDNDTDRDEYYQTAQEQAEQLVKAMYSCPKRSILDIPETRPYTEIYQEEAQKKQDKTDTQNEPVKPRKPAKLPEITDDLLCRVYVSAKEVLNVSDQVMSRRLDLTVTQYKKLLQNPRFAMAVQCGILDGRQEMYDDLTTSLYKLATGRFVVEEIKTETQDVVTMDGTKVGTNTKTSVVRRRVPPDAKLAQRLLSRIDPSWKQTDTDIDKNIQIAKDLKVTEDVTMSIDATKLPPDMLRYLIASNVNGIEGRDRVGGTVDKVLEIIPEQQELQKSLHEVNDSLQDAVVPTKERYNDTVVTPEQLDKVKHPRRGRPKKSESNKK